MDLWERHDDFMYGMPGASSITEDSMEEMFNQEDEEFLLNAVQNQENLVESDEDVDPDMLQELEEDGILLYSLLDHENNP